MQNTLPKIPFNKPFLTGNETLYITQAVAKGHLAGDGFFTKKVHAFFETHFPFKKCLLVHSCTAALEMSAFLLDIQPGDEVIMPAFTFVSTANAFVMRGAKVIFVDTQADFPNIDADKIEAHISEKTKAIVIVHYAGVACDMDKILHLTQKYKIALIEDAAHAIDSYYKGKALGSFGCMSTFSFHETKNVISGEGGLLVINNEKYIARAEIIREKGTNRAAFFRGEIDKYTWVDIGSSYLPSEIIAAFLYAQLNHLADIQTKRKYLWQRYADKLAELQKFGVKLPQIPAYATNNGHLFFMVCNNLSERSALISFLKKQNIDAVFHYQALHLSPFYQKNHSGEALPHTLMFADQLLRLPLFYDLSDDEQDRVIEGIFEFYENY
ncbi:MAG: dTDP-4-amino-4,6-dideoxygalactose transaminase [Chitinophagales bacterium]|nr:dTDP-4-amino-4,6-dideoxygalactose transaminase [Bacteroidota bacterium]MCB9042822.1 dTDP-4-amino-4,6-dideoxygalactose transaminase [Chitinophagales bacterium]